MDKQWSAQAAQDPGRLPGLGRGVRGDPDVESLACRTALSRAPRVSSSGSRDRSDRSRRVDVLQPHALQALVKAGQKVLARPPLTVGAGPHVISRLCADHQLVAEGTQVAAHHRVQGLLGGAVGRPVVVCQVEVGDAQIEGVQQGQPTLVQGPLGAEVLPQAQGDRGELEAAPAAAAVGHRRKASTLSARRDDAQTSQPTDASRGHCCLLADH
jgi:hypothetical protein